MTVAQRNLLGIIIALLAMVTAGSADAGTADDGRRFTALRAEAAALENGEGVAKDALRAFELYCQAARAGRRRGAVRHRVDVR